MSMYGYRACPECGAAVQRAILEAGNHTCAEERLVAHQTMIARRGLDRLEEDLEKHLTTNQGKYEQVVAKRLCNGDNA